MPQQGVLAMLGLRTGLMIGSFLLALGAGCALLQSCSAAPDLGAASLTIVPPGQELDARAPDTAKAPVVGRKGTSTINTGGRPSPNGLF